MHNGSKYLSLHLHILNHSSPSTSLQISFNFSICLHSIIQFHLLISPLDRGRTRRPAARTPTPRPRTGTRELAHQEASTRSPAAAVGAAWARPERRRHAATTATTPHRSAIRVGARHRGTLSAAGLKAHACLWARQAGTRLPLGHSPIHHQGRKPPGPGRCGQVRAARPRRLGLTASWPRRRDNHLDLATPFNRGHALLSLARSPWPLVQPARQGWLLKC